MKTTHVMRIELIVGLLGLICWMTAAQEIQPDEITTEWITTDLPTTILPALDVTTIRPADEKPKVRPQQIDSRARILVNSEFEDDPTLLTASQTGNPSAGSTLDNSLRSSNNNDWTPIVWTSTRLVPTTTLPSPIPSTRITAPGPSTLVIRPTPLLRPLPTIVAAPVRVASLSTQRASIRPLVTETFTLPSSSPQPVIVHFNVEDASSGPRTTVAINADSVIAPSVPIPATSIFINQTAELDNKIISGDNSSLLVSNLEESDNVTDTTIQPESSQPSVNPILVTIEEFLENVEETLFPTVAEDETLTFNQSLPSLVNETNSTSNSTDFVDDTEETFPAVAIDDSAGTGELANSSFVTQPSNETTLVTEDGLFEEEVITTQIEDIPLTTDFSTTPNPSNESIPIVTFPSNSSGLEEESNVTVVSVTDSSVPSTSQNSANISVTTIGPVTGMTSESVDLETTSPGEERGVINGKGNREESGRSTTLSALQELATLFPALTRPPTTIKFPAETERPTTTTTTPTPTTTTRTTTASIIFPSSVWTVSPQQAPPTPSIPYFVNPLAGWPTTTYNPPVTSHHPSVHHNKPTTTEYYPREEWPSTEGSQQSDDQDSTTTIVAISVSIAVFLCIAIGLLLFLVLRRRRARAVQGTCQPARMDAYSLDNVSQSNTWQRGKVRNSLRASKRSYLNQAFDDSTVFSVPLTAAQLALYMEKPITSIEAEFRNIATSTVRIDELPVGVETKNRYANVLPVPETRVHIRLQDNQQPMDTIEQYINANYIKGPKEEPNYYIACQGPMDETVQDFWQMIWENQCKIIVQLTDLSENGVARCAEYLPPSEVLDCHRLYGDYQVTLKSRELRDNYVTSHIQLKRMEDNLVREITHLWYSSWPSTGVPEDGKTVVALLMEARKGQSKENKAPVVIHCSPGTGRTGAVLAIDVCMRNLDSSRSIDIPRCVHRLRQDRAGCVQTGEQYAFIYKAVNHYASQLSNAALDSL